MHTKDKKLIIEAINIIKKYGSIEYAERFAEKLLKKAWKDVDKLLKPSPAKEKLKAFVDFAIRRDV
jgi:geranylgeranyl diphosphate synthase type I